MGEDSFIIFGAKSCLILWNNRGAFNAPPRQLTYIFDPAGNRVSVDYLFKGLLLSLHYPLLALASNLIWESRNKQPYLWSLITEKI